MFPTEEKFGLDELSSYAKKMMDNNVPRAIIVIKKEITNYSIKVGILKLFFYQNIIIIH
jgi:hypothetical protein